MKKKDKFWWASDLGKKEIEEEIGETKIKERKNILKEVKKWWNNPATCSGLPHCAINDCDLCMNCYEELLKIIGGK